MLAYTLPMFTGYLADAKFGRYPMIFWGVIMCGIGHVLIVAGGAKELIANGTAKIPFFIGVYILAIGAGKFIVQDKSTDWDAAVLTLLPQPCSSPTSLLSCLIR